MSGELPGGIAFELSPAPVKWGEERLTLRHPDGGAEEVALHDYTRVYGVPGLYEAVVQEALDCRSPAVTAAHAAAAVGDLGLDPATVRVLDVGAGNGVVGDELAAHGFRRMFGTDLLPAAADGAVRDRPALYEHYLAADLADPADPVHEAIERWDPQLLACAGALGGGHMSTVALARALNALSEPAIAVLTAGEGWLDESAADGLGAFVTAALADGTLEELRRERFRHRLTMSGDQIHYVALTLRVAGELALPRA